MHHVVYYSVNDLSAAMCCGCSNSADLMHLLELSLIDCTFILRIMHELCCVPLALQLTTIAGNTMVRVQ